MAHEATVKTAAVEVKALTISGKQVTLSVFRQLKNEPLIDVETGDLLGTPWGTVNYFGFENCRPNHLHVVWQKGKEIRRSCVYSWDSSPERIAAYAEKSEVLAMGELVRLTVGQRMSGVRSLDPLRGHLEAGFVGNLMRLVASVHAEDVLVWPLIRQIQHAGIQVRKVMGDNGPRLYFALPEAERERAEFWHGHFAAKREELLRAYSFGEGGALTVAPAKAIEEIGEALSWLQASEFPTDLAGAIERVEEAVCRYEALQHKWEQHYAELEQLDQLFIAV